MLRLLAIALALAPVAAGQAAYSVTLPDDGTRGAARDALHRGVELLHSFEYDDARDAFREARRLDALSVMAAWGEAMTHNHPVWQRQNTVEGRAVVAEIDDVVARRRDRGRSMSAGAEAIESYLDAVQTLFGTSGGPDKETRDDLYLDAMARHAAQHPSDRDGRAFYALALLGSAHEGRDVEVYEHAARVAQGVLDTAPDHPGALHYLIHAYDDPEHAHLALPAAEAYSEIVSAASHALHMPTHIYFALGRWEQASALNTRSYRAARDASARRGEALNNHGWHALYWLNYSELQLGRDERAMALLDTARARYLTSPSPLALAHLVRMRAQTAVTHVALNVGPAGPTGPDSALWRAFELDLPVDSASASTRAADLVASTMLLGGHGDMGARAAAIVGDAEAPALARATAQMVVGLASARDRAAVTRDIVAAAEAIEATPITFGPPLPALFPHELLVMVGLTGPDRDLARCLLDAVEARAPGRRITAVLRDGVDNAPSTPSGDAMAVTPSFCARD